MANTLEPLRLFVLRCPSLVTKASQLFASTKPIRQDVLRRAGQNLSTSEEESPDSRVNDSPDQADISGKDEIVSDGLRVGEATEPLFLETNYGLLLEVTDQLQGKTKVSDTSRKAQEQTPPDSETHRPQRYHYRLFPDWQTTYLWYDMSRMTGKDDIDEPNVDEDVIEERYPTLSSSYADWTEAYDAAFEKQECHLGSGNEVFPDLADRISWNVQGLLIASWLALQDDVASVEYVPRSRKYRIEKERIETDLLDHLHHIAADEEAVDQLVNIRLFKSRD